MNKIYHVYTLNTYDDVTETFAMCTSLEKAEELIREYIKQVWCFFSTKFYIEEWDVDCRWASKTVKVYNKDDVIRIGIELGVYTPEDK